MGHGSIRPAVFLSADNIRSQAEIASRRTWRRPNARQRNPIRASDRQATGSDRGAYAPKDYTREVIAAVNRLREKYGFTSGHEHREVVEKLATAATQMSLAIQQPRG
jgi:hypothetical protein